MLISSTSKIEDVHPMNIELMHLECLGKMVSTNPWAALGSTGKSIPIYGFGTAEDPFSSNNKAVKESVLHAIELGCRHFDTVEVYRSEQSLGEAIAKALRLGLIITR